VFYATQKEEPGQAHLRYLRQYRNPTGLITFPALFYERQLMVTSNFAIRHIVSDMNNYVKPDFAIRAMEDVIGKGLLTAEGGRHKRQRKVLNPAFAIVYIRDMVPSFWAKATELGDILLEQVNSKSGEGINISPILSRTTLDIIGSSGTHRSDVY
jgi:cytochrome P450